MVFTRVGREKGGQAVAEHFRGFPLKFRATDSLSDKNRNVFEMVWLCSFFKNNICILIFKKNVPFKNPGSSQCDSLGQTVLVGTWLDVLLASNCRLEKNKPFREKKYNNR